MADQKQKVTVYAPLMPGPGAHRLPVMNYVRISSTDDPQIHQMIFECEKQFGDRVEKLSISVPVPSHSLAGLLGNLRKLQELGKIPLVAEQSSQERPN
jgi:hypothetical protein